MADEDSEPEVFEIEDFTTASEWERFIAKLEEIIGSWHLENSQKKGLTKKDEVINSSDEPKKQNDAVVACQEKSIDFEAEWLIESKQLYFADFSFTLSHHKLSGNNVKDIQASSAPDDDGPSKAVMDMFDIEFDFPSRAHCISRWYGLKEFLILSPSNPNEDINTESRSKLLLSSVSIALSNTRCLIPGFVQIQQRWQRLFIGTCISNGFTSNFEMARLRNTPPQCSHLSGLLDIFKEKLAIPSRLIPPIMTSIRLTYILNWPEDEWVQEPPDFSTAFGSEVGYLNLSRQPFGPLQEPVSELHLATTWPCLSEETFVDHAEYTDLDPIEAPKWSLRARTADKCTSLLYDHLMAFIQICKKSESTAQIIRSLSKDQINIDSYGDITHALNRLTETTKPFQNQKRESSNKKPANREQMKLKESPLPEDLLNTILLHLFPDSHEDLKQAEERQRILVEEQKQLEKEGRKDRFRKMKSAPEKSLLYLLTICLSIVNYGYGGIKAFAHLWHEFILELRYRYENNIIIPRLALGPPNLNYCLIHQKLQMLNHCIEKKKLHHEESSQLFSTISSESSIRTTEGDEETPSKEIESNDNNERAVDFEIESESDDEFYEAVEEQSLSSESSSNIQINDSKQKERAEDDADNSPSGSFSHSENDNQSNNTDERHGVLKESDMKLLKTGKTLCIPITQEQQVMTEDMLEEHTEIIVKLAKSESGSKYLAQMQSLSLFSDIQAFKAANPGCIFEDFVRWYSPNDWIPGPETEREKEELRKMETEYQQSKNKADLMEVVGEEEIEGWDIDEDNEITEQELSALIDKEQNENLSELLEEGHLSVRMRIPGNIWVETWQTALPVAARRQKRLFDYTKEAEKVLHFLANLKPCEISSLLFPVFIHTAINRILLEEESSRSRILNNLDGIIHSTVAIQRHKDDISKMMTISRQLQISELAISRIQFLEKQFSKLANISEKKDCDENLKDFISKLLSTSEVTIEDGSRGKIGKIIQRLIENNQQVKNVTMEDSPGRSLSDVIKERHHKKLVFPNPAGREYILRTKINKPRECSRQSPQRLFSVITPDEFRLAAVFSYDTTFI